MNFRNWFLAENDIFGFEKSHPEELKHQELDNHPLKVFDVELMIEYLSKHRIGVRHPDIKFMNEIQWGKQSGALKLEVAPRSAVLIKKLGFDLLGNERWITKRYFQINRRGFGGYENAVAHEIIEKLDEVSSGLMDKAHDHYDRLDHLVMAISKKMRQSAKTLMIYEGIKRINDDNYLIIFGVRGHGLEAPSQRRVEEILTQVTYDRAAGTIRVENYKILSKVGGPHSWKVAPSDGTFYFFPTQEVDEICEAIATFWKYY